MVLAILLLLLPLAFAQGSGNPYTVTNIQSSSTGITATLVLSSSANDQYGTPISPLSMHINYYNADTVQIYITDPNNKRWEPPIETTGNTPSSSPNYKVNVSENPMGITITRNSDNFVVFNMAQTAWFMFDNHDLNVVNQWSEKMSIYGLGERISSFKLADGKYTMWARDEAGPYDDGNCGGGCNEYGVHPFYLALQASGSAMGGFLLNSNAMDAYVADQSLTFRFIGGVINYFVFIGPTPSDVVAQYHAVIGAPVLVPYWSMGWHQCRWGYQTVNETATVVDNYNKNNLPLDVMWNDIDYMWEYYDWTNDPTRYPTNDYKAFIKNLHDNGKHYMMIEDCGVAKQTSLPDGKPYYPWINGLLQEIWISSPHTGGAFVGKVWPGEAAWVDYFRPNATNYWVDEFIKFHENIEFDGIWLDMNEPSNFCNGECGQSECSYPLPYIPGGVDINSKTTDLLAFHYPDTLDGACNPTGNHIMFNTHSLFGYMEAKATTGVFEKLGKRTFIISRSTFATGGRYNSHWLGDNYSTWEFLGYSIAGILDFQMFGFPMVGADICGFNDNTTEELCLRWMQLGTLYPFSRNHNTIHATSQEPYAFSSAMTAASEQAIRIRYSLINYMYTLMFNASLSGSGMIWKATLFAYPYDTNLHEVHASDNFMIGDALLVHPCLAKGALVVNGYFPADQWYDFYTGELLTTNENYAILSAQQSEKIPIHMRQGYIVPTLDGSATAMSTTDLRKSPVTLTITPDGNGSASGQMILDDGLSPNTIESKTFTSINYTFSTSSTDSTKHTLAIDPTISGYTRASGEFPNISTIKLYGCAEITEITLSGTGPVKAKIINDTAKKVGIIVFQDDTYAPDSPVSFEIIY